MQCRVVVRLDPQRRLILRLRLPQQFLRSRRVARAPRTSRKRVAPIVQRLVVVGLDPQRRLILRLRLPQQFLRSQRVARAPRTSRKRGAPIVQRRIIVQSGFLSAASYFASACLSISAANGCSPPRSAASAVPQLYSAAWSSGLILSAASYQLS